MSLRGPGVDTVEIFARSCAWLLTAAHNADDGVIHRADGESGILGGFVVKVTASSSVQPLIGPQR